jgi:hypothetical protein
MPVFPTTVDRVAVNSDEAINRRIRRQIEVNVHYYALHPQEIDGRLAELDREWDIERTLETTAASFMLGGTLLGLLRHRAFLALPLAVGAFLLQHALQGWCPPAAVLRRQGVRTAAEIGRERAALKALRGDFASVERMPNAAERANAAFQGVSA